VVAAGQARRDAARPPELRHLRGRLVVRAQGVDLLQHAGGQVGAELLAAVAQVEQPAAVQPAVLRQRAPAVDVLVDCSESEIHH